MSVRIEKVQLPVSDGTTMPAYVAYPATPAPNAPGLILLQDAFGTGPHMQDVARRFAEQGYLTILPGLFHRSVADFEDDNVGFEGVMPHIQSLTDEGQAADFQAAYDWLVSAEDGAAGKVAALGFCMGGRSDFLANATLPLSAAVSYYGSGIAPTPRKHFADLLGRIPRLSGPALFYWGGQDQGITPDQWRAVQDAMEEAGKLQTHVVFSQAGHAFFREVGASYEPQAAQQSWVLTLAFLEEHLQ